MKRSRSKQEEEGEGEGEGIGKGESESAVIVGHDNTKNSSLTTNTNTNGILCNESSCCNNFIPIELYDFHVSQCHDHQCSQCLKSLPNQYRLQLHIDELHNPFKNNQQKQSLRCFKEECSVRFETHQDRISHLCKIHDEPGFLDFDV
ncbi:uncharacterized protein NDAI_0A07840 [Naumovozyma dairenensis CBS 421]|uniref:C2H2-type domain-containing protein n=1 Tax=Naumovozyma dairenensis (strain ATCC 10597 / BCRC 20456 / CBS 421 / NBRC 0211 / NRRL Y-12639) TaxID=1071378 RepID=G0W550_NAUDC|nr:hypothetical protein NDAI_0A07840 [Naumovozyma dairenensis CBS 421]CCD22938.1 hypothetical protein NDAI_0A07840 [Naumovozyma dairenensis CBS 421]